MAKPLGGYTARQLDHILATGSLEEFAAATKTPLAANRSAARGKTPTAPTDAAPAAKAPVDDTSAGRTQPATTDGATRAFPHKANKLDPRGTGDGLLVSVAGDRYVQYPATRTPDGRDLPAELYGFTERGAMPLLTGALAVTDNRTVRDITPRLTAGDPLDTVVYVSYTSPEGDRIETTFTGTDAGESRPTWPQRLGISMRTATRKFAYVGSAIKALAADWAADNGGVRQAYASTGLLLTDSGPQYLRIGGPALTADGFDPNTIVHLPAGVDRRLGHLSLPDPSSEGQAAEDFWELIKVLELMPGQPVVPLALLAQLAWAPWANRYGMVSLIIAGETGSRKSAMAGVIMATQSRTEVYGPGQEPRATAKLRHGASTAIGIDRALYPLGGMVGLVDDGFATKATPNEYVAQWRTLSLIGDNTATQSGSAKGAREAGSMRPEEYPRACLLVTAERLPGESDHGSEVARYVAFTLSAPVDLDALSTAQTESATRARGRAHAAMIQAGLADIEAPARALAWANEQVDSWGNVGHGRAKIGYTTLLAGARLLAERAVRLQMAESADHFMESLGVVELLRVACEDQARRAGTVSGQAATSDYVGVFCRTVREMLSEQALWVADGAHAENGHRPPAATGVAGAGALGWRQSAVSGEALTAYDNGVMWQPGRGDPVGGYLAAEDHGRPTATGFAHALHVPSRSWSDVMAKVGDAAIRLTGWSLPGPDEMLALLVKAGIATNTQNAQQRIFGGKPRCYTFDLARLLGADDEQGDDDGPSSPEPDSGPEPSRETPALWVNPSEDDQSDQDDQAPANPVNDALVAEFQLGGPELPCVFCTEPTTGHLYGRPAHMTCALDAQPDDERLTAPPVQPNISASIPGVWSEQRRKAITGARNNPAGQRIATLDLDGLRVSVKGEPIPVDLPALSSISDLYELTCNAFPGRKARRVYVTARALDAMGLPLVLPTDLDPTAPIGAYPHPWSEPNAGVSFTTGVAVGLSRWMTVSRADAPQVHVVVPAWDTSAIQFNGQAGGLNIAQDGASLLDAISLLTSAIGVNFYRSTNQTARTVALLHSSDAADPFCEAIRQDAVTGATEYRKGLPVQWDRKLTDDEKVFPYVHEYDRNAAYLLACNTPVGIGEPTHRLDSVTFDRKQAAYWRVTSKLPVTDPRLPALTFPKAKAGGHWLTTPEVDLMIELDPEWSVHIAEAWVWETTSRALDAFYRVMRDGRKMILAARDEEHRPGAVPALAAFKGLYTSFIGSLRMKPKADKDDDSKLWDGARHYRPDWSDQIISAAEANLYRAMVRTGHQADRWPLAVNVDSVAYVSDQSDPIHGRPDGMAIGFGGAEWKVSGTAPLAAVLKSNKVTHKAISNHGKGEK